ncbi:glycosyltransferase family 2 protein [Bacteroidia bacterium]|nr:glycosyltransferase family 2 protein [Bacteroidia bacterium]
MTPSIDISIIIVNYNVKYFLEQCLGSIYAKKTDLKLEVIVVDNNSVDGSVQLIKSKFPQVKCIANTENVGFSKANNQAMGIALGKYQLILNPDTVLEQNTLPLCFEYMEQNPTAGALGVRMIDGNGTFLPESKRGLPTPAVAFYKMALLNKLFPKSQTFGRYHAGYLAEDEINEVDVLSGAFMFIRTAVLDKIGFFDETYFMYGEDIDLSYRITKAGYNNIYFPKSTIIHYKGESTKRKTVNYVRTFYNAMIIFAQTHYTGTNQKWMVYFLQFAIWARAGVALIQRLLEKVWAPLLDIVVLYSGFYFLAKYWEVYNRFVQYYSDEYYFGHLPLYVILLLIIVKLSGGYSFPYKLYRSQRGIILGSLILIAIYGLLPKDMQFSRAIVLLGSLWSLIGISISRYLINYFKTGAWEFNPEKNQRIAIMAQESEYNRVVQLFEKVGKEGKVIGNISPDHNKEGDLLGSAEQLKDIISIYRINELIFCAKDLPSEKIIKWMSDLSNEDIKYKIVPAESEFIVGSHSKNAQGELFSIDIQMLIGKEENRLKKRLLDFLFGLLLLILLPLSLIKPKKIGTKIANAFALIWGSKTLISYVPAPDIKKLPPLKQGLLFPASKVNASSNSATINRVNFLYAKDYTPGIDLELFIKNLKKLTY